MNDLDWICLGCAVICCGCVLLVYVCMGIFQRMIGEMKKICDSKWGQDDL